MPSLVSEHYGCSDLVIRAGRTGVVDVVIFRFEG